ncbi:polysaccharide deacetylase family protein [Kocuria sp. M1R5S2]|uniref:polysaccharide deacetylase family protein n=1 Tax=Kocuria rhizosphaerae TaxID=3376285 RepID=UPI0037BB36B0
MIAGPRAAGVVQGLARPAAAVLGTPVRVRTDAPRIALTFDDGPVRPTTPQVLDVLERFGARATFFVLLTRVHADPGLLREVRDRGHEIGLHGPDHRSLRRFSAGRVRDRTRRARGELEDVTGGPVRWFRPPYGEQSPARWAAVRSTGLEPVLWSATTWDWKHVGQQERVAKALDGCSAGAVLLAHDNFADHVDGVDDGPRPDVDTVDLLTRVLAGLSERGLTADSVSGLLATGRFERRVSFAG